MTKKTVKSYAQESVGIRLSSHEKLCAERMKKLDESIRELNSEVNN